MRGKKSRPFRAISAGIVLTATILLAHIVWFRVSGPALWLDQLGQEGARTRIRAAAAFGQFGTSDEWREVSVDALLHTVKDVVPEVRAAAFASLKQIGPRSQRRGEIVEVALGQIGADTPCEELEINALRVIAALCATGECDRERATKGVASLQSRASSHLVQQVAEEALEAIKHGPSLVWREDRWVSRPPSAG